MSLPGDSRLSFRCIDMCQAVLSRDSSSARVFPLNHVRPTYMCFYVSPSLGHSLDLGAVTGHLLCRFGRERDTYVPLCFSARTCLSLCLSELFTYPARQSSGAPFIDSEKLPDVTQPRSPRQLCQTCNRSRGALLG